MNVYDFDKTIFRGDSTVALLFYVLPHRPASLRSLPALLGSAVLFSLKIISKRRFKERVYSFCRYVTDMDSLLDDFWAKHYNRIYPWYLAQKSPEDVIISASSEFALRPVCRRLGVELIATLVDPHTGKYLGENCHGKEKLRRFRERFGDAQPDNFYSDSRSDEPMAKIAKKAYIVNGGNLSDW